VECVMPRRKVIAIAPVPGRQADLIPFTDPFPGCGQWHRLMDGRCDPPAPYYRRWKASWGAQQTAMKDCTGHRTRGQHPGSHL
jgi:hypothetical protein